MTHTHIRHRDGASVAAGTTHELQRSEAPPGIHVSIW
jgi:hypothetical protein